MIVRQALLTVEPFLPPHFPLFHKGKVFNFFLKNLGLSRGMLVIIFHWLQRKAQSIALTMNGLQGSLGPVQQLSRTGGFDSESDP